MKNEALFRTGSVWRAIFTMAVPSVVIIFVMFLYNIADMFFIGCLGDTVQVAAVSVVGPVFSILAAAATMLGAGGCTIIARCLGAGEVGKGRVYSSLCCWAGTLLGVLVCAALLLSGMPLLQMLGSTPETTAYALLHILGADHKVLVDHGVIDAQGAALGQGLVLKVVNGVGKAHAQGQMAGGVFVEQRVVEQQSGLADGTVVRPPPGWSGRSRRSPDRWTPG